MSQETIEQRFEVGSPAKLKLSNIRGSVDIRAGEDNIIAVTAVKYLKSGNADLTEIKIEQADDGLVSVKTDYQNSISNWFGVNKPCKVDYTVQVPKDCDVHASGVSCEVSVRGLTGAINISSVSGELTLAELSGSLKISAVSGSINAEKLTGELEANAVSGKIRIMDSQLSKTSIKTVSGSMVIQTPLSEGPYHFKGVSGSATLIVPADTACSANFRSVSGRMRTSMPITKDQRYGSRGSMEIQGGGPEVSYNCVSGAFKIVTAENQVITEHKAPVESESKPKNQLDVLQKIERGEISVEDALKELNA